MSWDRFNDQFRETESERRERWAATRAKRKAEGKCWQCAKPVAECKCPNVKHEKNSLVRDSLGHEDGCPAGDFGPCECGLWDKSY